MRFQLEKARRAVIYLLFCAAVLTASPWTSLAQQRGGASAPPSPLTGAEDKTIAISTDLVSLQVNVMDKKGRFAPGLDRGAFAVYEDGVRQEISFFSKHDDPAAVGVVLDVSASMTGAKIERAREALRRFIQTSHEEDEYFLIGFNQFPQLLLDGAPGSEAMAARISGIEPHGATALYDAVVFGLGQVKRSRLQKRALIVISDGEDNRSRLGVGDVRRMLRESDVIVYTILIGSLIPRSNGGMIMDELASASGGKSFSPSNSERMSEAFEQIALELRRQYSIGYTPSNLVTDGKWRRVEVKVTPPPGFPRLVARNRKGYYALGHTLVCRGSAAALSPP
jgi:Ca-activated chloride channel family protein